MENKEDDDIECPADRIAERMSGAKTKNMFESTADFLTFLGLSHCRSLTFRIPT
jgi:hypothetical protein